MSVPFWLKNIGVISVIITILMFILTSVYYGGKLSERSNNNALLIEQKVDEKVYNENLNRIFDKIDNLDDSVDGKIEYIAKGIDDLNIKCKELNDKISNIQLSLNKEVYELDKRVCFLE